MCGALVIGLAVACGGDEAREVRAPWGGQGGGGLDGGVGDHDGGSVGEEPNDASGTSNAPETGLDASSGGGADDGGTAGDEGNDDDSTPPWGDCPANCYCEPFDLSADIGDLEASFNGNNWADVMIGVLERRYPAGADLLVEMQDDPWFGAFTDTSSFTGLMDSVMTEVHEGTHGWDYGHALGQPYFGYWLRADLVFEPPKVDGFPRSEIAPMLVDDSTSLYAGTYLTGTQGTYGFYELLDEMNSYINGMGGIAAVGEHIPWGISGRDGAVAFMYYLQLYLRRARTTYPELYAQLQAEPEYVDLIRTQWLRLHFLLEQADAHPHLGIHDDEIRAHMHELSNQEEIETFIGQPIDASSCLP